MRKRRENETKIKRMKVQDIEYLHLGFIICKKNCEREVRKRILELGGRVLSIHDAKGVGRNAVADVLNAEGYSFSCIVCNLREEDAKNIIAAISAEFNFNEQGNGKAFTLRVLGYMGNKALFV